MASVTNGGNILSSAWPPCPLLGHAATGAEAEGGKAATMRESEAFAEACGAAAQQVGLQERPLRRLLGHESAVGVETLPYTKEAISGRWLKVCCGSMCWPISMGWPLLDQSLRKQDVRCQLNAPEVRGLVVSWILFPTARAQTSGIHGKNRVVCRTRSDQIAWTLLSMLLRWVGCSDEQLASCVVFKSA
jgi:hypothetical protein